MSFQSDAMSPETYSAGTGGPRSDSKDVSDAIRFDALYVTMYSSTSPQSSFNAKVARALAKQHL